MAINLKDAKNLLDRCFLPLPTRDLLQRMIDEIIELRSGNGNIVPISREIDSLRAQINKECADKHVALRSSEHYQKENESLKSHIKRLQTKKPKPKRTRGDSHRSRSSGENRPSK